MPSQYGQADIYSLEGRSGIDYSKKLTKYTDRVLNGVISQGEREINTKAGPFTGVRGYQEVGLSAKLYTSGTGLTAATPYYFKINLDGAGVIEYIITTGTDVTYDAVILLMNAQLVAVHFILVGGDLRCTSKTIGSTSTIELSAGSTGTDLFATLTGWSAFETAVVGSGSVPDAIEFLAIELAYRRMYNMMVWDGAMDRKNPKKRLMPVWDDELKETLQPFIAKTVNPIKKHRLYSSSRDVSL